uniref:Uncharacterized protein n=1 Tax=Strigamia maritima TaxID=126957 RepID=T1IMA9_STRMM
MPGSPSIFSMDEGTSNDARNTSEESDAEMKPFKKAKYAWQIKGRARWKNKRVRSRKTKNAETREKNETETRKSTESISTPTSITQPQNNDVNVNSPPDVDGFMSILNPERNNVRKWQTKQVAKAIIDNAINKVLEDLGVIPLPDDAFDFHLVDSDIDARNIEDKGVSEAIRQQGLHRRRRLLPESENTTTCTYWLHWNADEKEAEVKLPVQENVLDAAVSFAINEKGLGVLSQG